MDYTQSNSFSPSCYLNLWWTIVPGSQRASYKSRRKHYILMIIIKSLSVSPLLRIYLQDIFSSFKHNSELDYFLLMYIFWNTNIVIGRLFISSRFLNRLLKRFTYFYLYQSKLPHWKCLGSEIFSIEMFLDFGNVIQFTW